MGTLRKIEVRFSIDWEVSCKTHKHTGKLPCPWPNCSNGISDSEFIGYTPGIDKHHHYKRKKWHSLEGEERYTWDDLSFFSYFQAPKLLREENLRTIGQEPEYIDPIFHYTDINGLYGIISSDEIWLTDFSYMNDAEEVMHGFNLAKEIIYEFKESNKHLEAIELLDSWEDFLKSGVKNRICIACFTQDTGDSLTQWRGYGGKGVGVAIGFNVQGTNYWIGRQAHLNRVIYELSVQKRILSNLFHIYLVMSDWDKGKQIAGFRGKKVKDREPKDFSDLVLSNLYQNVIFIKNNVFSDEREVRWVYIEDERVYSSLGLNLAPKRFRISGNRLIPYVSSIDLKVFGITREEDKKTKLPISEVVVGPQENMDIVESGIRELLDSKGYNSAKVRRSKIPFRP